MVIGNGAGKRASLVRFEHPSQSVMFIAHLILGHLASSPANDIESLVAKNTGRNRILAQWSAFRNRLEDGLEIALLRARVRSPHA
jgi:hypothetical protein